MAIVIPIFLANVNYSTWQTPTCSVPFGVMDKEGIGVAIFFTFLFGAGIGFYLAGLIL